MIRLYRSALFLLFLLICQQAQSQVDTTGVTIANVTCNGGNNGSVIYNIGGGPGPVKYSWSNGITGYATGSCTYAVNVNNPGAALTQFQIQVNVNLATGMHADFSNIVFMDSAGNLFPFWLTDFPTASTASFWVRVPNIPAGNSVFYLSFCGSATVSASNPVTTFEFFDNFDGGSIAAYTDTCVNVDVAGESCTVIDDNTTSFSPGYSLSPSGASSCFTAPYDGAGSKVSRTVAIVNDSLVMDYEDKVAVTLYGFCSGGTGSTNTVFADDVNLGNGQTIGVGGTCSTNTSPWKAETSLPFSVTTGTVTFALQTYGGDCDNSQGWFDDVRIRKYRYNPPTDTLLVTPQLSLNNLTAGNYTLTLTDINGNTVTRTLIISQPSALQVAADSSNNPCAGSGNGFAWAVVNNGTSPYSLLWNSSQTTDTITGLSPATYTVTATDNNGCTASAATHIALVAPLQVIAQDDSVNCFGNSTGTAWAVVSGGQAPYQYIWSNSSATDTITALAAGVYNVIVTDADGCTANTALGVNQPSAALITTGMSSPISCFGYTNGRAWAISTGGTAPYQYIWNTSQTTDTISNLSSGTYLLTATDNAGCTAASSITISPPNPQLTLSFDSVNVLCNGNNTGSALANINGGTTPYTLRWSNNAASTSITALTAGDYTLTVTDLFGCTVTGNVNITQPLQGLGLSVQSHSPVCAGLSTGSAAATATGGVPPYSFNWSTGAGTDSVSGLVTGVYSLTLTDNNHCTQTSQVTIAPSEVITIAEQKVTPTCADSSNGTISISVSGGTMPYIYVWSNGSTSQNLTNAPARAYSLVVTDNLGCSAAFSDNVPAENFSATISAQPDSVILNGDQVTLAVNGSGAVSAIWQPIVSFNDSSGLSVTAAPATTTIYQATIASDVACKTTASITIIVKPKPKWLVPTGFSPNGDGVNDYFHVVLRGPVQFISLSVFNRWGEKIFETNDPDPGWDGTFQERPQPVGVYIYQLQIRNLADGAGTIISESGNVTLIR